MKYYAFTTNPEGFIDGYSSSFILRADKENAPEDWVFLQEVDFNPDAIDISSVRQAAVKSIDAEMEKQRVNFTAGMERLQNRKESLLAIEHQSDE